MALLIPGVGVVDATGTLLVPGAGVATVSVPPTITTTSLTALQVGVAFSQQLAATGDAPITWTGTVPDGLTLSSSGMLSGTPTTAGAYSFTVTATNAAGSDDQAYSGTIVVAVPVITTTDLGTLTVGTPYSLQLVATGGEPITWSVTSYTADGDTYTVDSATWTADNTTGLPPGLSLSSSGVLSGTPTLAGSYSFTITATNAGGSDDQLYEGTVEAAEVASTRTGGDDKIHPGWNRKRATLKRDREREFTEQIRDMYRALLGDPRTAERAEQIVASVTEPVQSRGESEAAHEAALMARAEAMRKRADAMDEQALQAEISLRFLHQELRQWQEDDDFESIAYLLPMVL